MPLLGAWRLFAVRRGERFAAVPEMPEWGEDWMIGRIGELALFVVALPVVLCESVIGAVAGLWRDVHGR